MKFIKFIVSLLLAAGLTYALNRPWGKIPALGRFFSPFEGFWTNGEPKADLPSMDLKLEGIKEEVTIHFDENHVPHIFANNEEDLYFAQGYIMARDRMFQMDFTTRAAAGRISEMVGADRLETDKYIRRMGMPMAAEKMAVEMGKDPVAKRITEAYSKGFNAYLSQIRYKDYPVEYKLLGFEPEQWSPLKSALLLVAMRQTLNGGSDDLRMSNILAKYGRDVAEDLFPNYPSDESPIIPVGTKWDFTPLKVPAPPAEVAAKMEVAMNAVIPTAKPEVGSNNWAVGGEKSATGLPILANDPHLNITLPSIWYQMQLVAPNVNVYGVTLPGSPGIVIGFNKDVAWGVTNVGSDVMDFYQIKFKDKSMKEYFYNGGWKPTTMRIEEIKVKKGTGIEIVKDTVYYTHHGPVVYSTGQKALNPNIPVGCAMRWVTHEASGNDMLTFYYLNRAKTYDDYRKALTYYTAPAQNFIFASNQNDISITPNGKFPIKWKGQGKYIMDGSMPENDWQGWIPTNQNPTVKNPPRGFVSSANQFSTDPTYPYYLGWKFAPAERGVRINERLAKMEKATPDSLRMLQNDNFNVDARRILSDFLKILNADSSQNNNEAYKTLASWNMVNDANSVGATIFERWLRELRYQIWEDEFNTTKEEGAKMMYPTRDRTWNMIKNQPTAKWFDNVNTKDKQETVQDILKLSFKAAVDSLTMKLGPMTKETWAWNKSKSTDIKHIIPVFASFGRMDVPNGGGGTIVNATTETHGPSWRMVVAVGKDGPKAYGLYPGGQSGNPGSQFYENMIDKWANGELNELLYMKAKDEKSDRIKQTVKMKAPNS